MKKLVIITLLSLGALSSPAQHYLGGKVGYGAAYGRVYTVRGVPENAMMWGKYSAGVVWKYFSPQQVVGGVSAELEFQQRGYRIYDAGNSDYISVVISDETEYREKTRTVSSITMPLIWQPHLYFLKRQVRFYLSLGITFTYNLGIGDKYTITNYGFDTGGNRSVTSNTVPYTMNTARDVRWHYGWLGGAGFSVLVGRYEFFAEGRYYYGMSDILRNDTKYRFNEERALRSELDNIFISVGATFRLGKGGILAPPLRRQRATPIGNDDFRNIKPRY